MDPITITTSVLTTTRICLGAAKRLYDIVDRYRHASKTIAAIYSESMVIGASLRQLQNILSQNEETYIQQFQNQPDLSDVFEAALLGCTLVYSCLDDEVQHLRSGTNDISETGRLARARFLWKEETMRELLQSIRAQNAAITLLLQCLQFETVSSMQKTLEDVRQMVVGINDLVVTSAEYRPSVAQALLQSVSTPRFAYSQAAHADVSEGNASILGLAPSTRFQSSRRSGVFSVSDGSFETLASNNGTKYPSLTSDLFRRLSQRLSEPWQLGDAPPDPTIPSPITSSAKGLPSTTVSSPETHEEANDSSIDGDTMDEGYGSDSDALDHTSITSVIPPLASTSTILDVGHPQDQNLSKSTLRRDLKDSKSEQEKLSADTTTKSTSAENPTAQARDNSGTMIEQAVDRFMKRVSLATRIPASIADIQHQGQERQPVAFSSIKSLSSQSEPSLSNLEPLATSTSTVESATAEHITHDHLQSLSSSTSSQQVIVHGQESDARKCPLPYDIDEAIDRVLQSNSRTHLRVTSASPTTTTLSKPNVRLTLAVLDSFGASRGEYNN